MRKHPPMRSRYHRLSVMGMLLPNLWLVGWLSACGGPVNPDYCSIAPPNRDPHFAMTGGLLYLEADYSNSLYAVRASDGVRQWQYNASGRVSVFDDRVYYSSTDLYALRASDGKPLWHTSQSMGLIEVTHSMVFARSADRLYALNASNGSQLWQQKIDLNYPLVSIQVAESFC